MADQGTKGDGAVSPEVKAAVEDARLLLDHASRSGKTIPPDTISTITDSGALVRAESMTPEQEARFWTQFNVLVKLVRPVTIDSLKATADWQGEYVGFPWLPNANRRKLSLAGLEIRRYRIWAIFSLFLLLFTQIYFLIGSTVVTNISELPAKIDETRAEIAKYKREYEINLRRDDGNLNAYGDNIEILDQITHQNSQLISMNVRLDTSYVVLNSWNKLWYNLFYVFSLGLSFDPDKNNRIDLEKQKNIDFQSASFVLQAFQQYLLPLLYGILGGCAYILRTVSQEVKNKSYSAESKPQYQLRLYLAAVAGLAIGWFLSPEDGSGGLISLPPLAVAFLAGYSVEILFSALDGFVSAFTKKQP